MYTSLSINNVAELPGHSSSGHGAANRTDLFASCGIVDGGGIHYASSSLVPLALWVPTCSEGRVVTEQLPQPSGSRCLFSFAPNLWPDRRLIVASLVFFEHSSPAFGLHLVSVSLPRFGLSSGPLHPMWKGVSGEPALHRLTRTHTLAPKIKSVIEESGSRLILLLKERECLPGTS